MKKIILKSDREKSVLRHHPWIFSGAILKIDDDIENGETVEIYSSEKKFLGVGGYSKYSQINVRMWSFEDEKIDNLFFRKKILDAFEYRNLFNKKINSNAFRMINAESDFIPGLIVDVYEKNFVVQFLFAGTEFHKKTIIDEIINIFEPKVVIERNDLEIRTKEGLKQEKNILFGKLETDLIEVEENGIKFFVDVWNGHKTGAYLDQKENRFLVSKFVNKKNVLNCFSYTGGFSLFSQLGNAQKITNIESSKSAIKILEKNFVLNNFSCDNIENIEGDVFQVLRKYRDMGKSFDVIILDPPKFIESKIQIEKGSRGYKDINLLAMKLLNKNGLLFTFSCSGLMTKELFQKIVADAALDAKKNVQFIQQLSQSIDHTTSTNFPEGNYLKGFLCIIK